MGNKSETLNLSTRQMQLTIPNFLLLSKKKKSIIDFTAKHNAFADLWMGANPPST